MSAVAGIDLGAVFATLGQWMNSFFQLLVQYAPYIIGLTIGGYLVYRFARMVRQSLGQFLALF